MKLHEIKKSHGVKSKNVTIEPGDGRFGNVKFHVEYTIDKGDTTRHGDDSSFDETTYDVVDLHSVKTAEKVTDGEGNEWPKWTNLSDLPSVTNKDSDKIEELL